MYGIISHFVNIEIRREYNQIELCLSIYTNAPINFVIAGFAQSGIWYSCPGFTINYYLYISVRKHVIASWYVQRKVIKLTLCNTIKYGQRQLILKYGRFLCTFRKSTANHFRKFIYVCSTGSFNIIHIMNKVFLNSDYVTLIERYCLFCCLL